MQLLAAHRWIVSKFALVLILFIQGCNDVSSELHLTNGSFSKEWKNDSLAPGIVWKSKHFKNLFNSKQNVNILDVEMSIAQNKIDFVYSDSLLFLTSSFGGLHNGIAAINGTFFNIKDGGSYEYLKVNNKIISNALEEPLQLYKGEAAIVINEFDEIDIIPKQDSEYYSNKHTDMIASGPLLIINNKINSFPEDKFCLTRNPRTAVGITVENHLLLVTIDGRSNESEGLTIPELALLMKSLKRSEALNLDGGGSIAMWINGCPYNGIVNNPSDNKKYDHHGQRPVANAIVINSN